MIAVSDYIPKLLQLAGKPISGIYSPTLVLRIGGLEHADYKSEERGLQEY